MVNLTLRVVLSSKTMKVTEKDFVIINATHNCIVVIEVKNSLGTGDSVVKSIKHPYTNN